MIRLSKYLHQCGLGSRNQCEDLIHSNRIKVNDILVREPFTRVSENDKVQLDDQILETQKDKLYFLLNKPKGFSCMTTTEDQKVSDLVSHLPYRLFTVGFLDVQAEGLIFLTNDGDFTHRMSASEIEKEYLIQVDQPLTKEHLMLLSEGNPIDEASFIPPLHV
jgi:23S rRNA pseudouridine2605 synthase